MNKTEDLFAWIGACIAEVIRSAANELSSAEKEELVIGTTFSFPMTQTCLGEATPPPMGKGFAVTLNLKLGTMLLAGYECHPDATKTSSMEPMVANNAQHQRISAFYMLPKLRLAAITNDVISTFISVAYTAKTQPKYRTAMGLLNGTGTNAAISLRLHRFPVSKTSHSNPKITGDLSESDRIVTDAEWSVRPTGDPLLELRIPTEWDRRLDEQLPRTVQGFQPLEYMTAGRYSIWARLCGSSCKIFFHMAKAMAKCRVFSPPRTQLRHLPLPLQLPNVTWLF